MGKWISLTPFVSLPGGNPDDRPAPPTTHTYTQTRPTFCHNGVVMWWECVCTGRASSLVSQLFAVGVLWLHVRPRLNPFTLCPQSGLCCRTHTHPHPVVHIILNRQLQVLNQPKHILKTIWEAGFDCREEFPWLSNGTVDQKNKKYPTLERGNKSISYNFMVWDYI